MHPEHHAGHHHRARVAQQLAHEVLAEARFGAGAGDEDTGRGGDQQRGDLRDEAVADAQEREALHRFLRGQAHLQDADDEAADEVDAGDEHARHGVAADELARTVHRAVEVGFLLDELAAVARLLLGDDAGVEIGVDAHLLAGHRVQGEARGHFRHAARALGDDDEIDDRQDDEDHQADDEVALHDELAEGGDEIARVALGQDRARGGDVEAEAEERDEEQQAWGRR